MDSIREQIFQDWEAILVDDGSTDRSGEICDLYAEQDTRFRVLHQKNMGVSIARKSGGQCATGQYISFVDSDDWISPLIYQNMYDKIQEYNADAVLLNSYTEETGDQSCEEKWSVSEGFYDRERMEKEIFPKIISNGGFFGSGMGANVTGRLFCREYLMPWLNQSRAEFIMAEDAAVVYPTILACNRIYVYEDCDAYHYRLTEGSLTHSYRKNYFEMCKNWRSYMLEVCVPLWDGNLEEQINSYYASMAITACLNEYRYYSPYTRQEKKEQLKKFVSDNTFQGALQKMDRTKCPLKVNAVIYLIRLKMYRLLHLVLLVKEGIRSKS
ncbi:MAG: glycosyltransferase [Bacteroides sp.]|nr:glycosyltransferase [Bacteroides sp.]